MSDEQKVWKSAVDQHQLDRLIPTKTGDILVIVSTVNEKGELTCIATHVSPDEVGRAMPVFAQLSWALASTKIDLDKKTGAT